MIPITTALVPAAAPEPRSKVEEAEAEAGAPYTDDEVEAEPGRSTFVSLGAPERVIVFFLVHAGISVPEERW